MSEHSTSDQFHHWAYYVAGLRPGWRARTARYTLAIWVVAVAITVVALLVTLASDAA